MSDWQVTESDCLDWLRSLPDSSVDALVTDPPAGIGFMGKAWDSFGATRGSKPSTIAKQKAESRNSPFGCSGVPAKPAPGAREGFIDSMREVFAECLRVLKPGAHGLVWSLPRTSHWTGTALEDAGFEVRDVIAHMFGTGFPKSLDVSKAIDKAGGNAHLAPDVAAALRTARKSRGITKRQADEMFCGGTTNWSWFEGRPRGQRCPSDETFAAIVHAWPELAPLSARVAAVNREVIGHKQSGLDRGSGASVDFSGSSGRDETGLVPVTAPATPAAQQWDGWGTALKPAREDWWLVRKPLDGTVAANVLAHGVGGLNVDGCRVPGKVPQVTQGVGASGSARMVHGNARRLSNPHDAGRWPPHILFSEHPDELHGPGCWLGDKAKFFPRFKYQAKPSRKERDRGVNFCACKGGPVWASEGPQVATPAETDTPREKATTESNTTVGCGSPTASSGSSTTGQSRRATKSTTATETSKTTASRIYNSSRQPSTNGCTAGADEPPTAGGSSPAVSAASSSASDPSTGISAEKAGRTTDAADPATSQKYARRSGCAVCGGLDPKSRHPTQKPIELMRWLCRLITPPGGLLIDPFTGSGTTGVAAVLEGFRFAGCEREPEYAEIARARIGAATHQVKETYTNEATE